MSVLESGYMLGDGVWEGMRLHRGVLLFAAQHMDRLYEGAAAIDMDIGGGWRRAQKLVWHGLLLCTLWVQLAGSS